MKQPYVLAAFTPFFLSLFLSLINPEIEKKEKAVKVVVFAGSIIFLFLSIKAWNGFLLRQKEDFRNTSSQLVERMLFNGLSRNGSVLIVENDEDKIDKYKFFTHTQKNYYSSDNNDADKNPYLILAKEREGYKEVDYKGDSQLGILFFLFKTYPGLVMKSYAENFLTILNIIPYKLTPYYQVGSGSFSLTRTYQIGKYFYVTYKGGFISKTRKSHYKRIAHYDRVYETPVFIKKLLTVLENKSNILFSTLFLLLPLYAIFTLVKANPLNRSQNEFDQASVLIGGSIFIHIAFHAFFGSTIDRYGTPVYSIAIIMFVSILSDKFRTFFKLQK